MIKSWTDPAGVTHYADEHSKAYRIRTEAKPDTDTRIDPAAGQTVEDVVDKAEKPRRAVTVKAPEA
ncbi:hypothetical protein CRM89_00360 [Nocardia sp. FDAARGOS_372]|uniref:DUF4124 domain-containing protein n=1 Tax=Nocardia farcinica (strain IFM 10152) TaxID=247156 RepID=Q5YZL4_NOCFA|nr:MULTISPECIES: hypothetical protein [Nocardia]PEH74638.1 hypothetical protein CRM89_00360 [Nocardia sp. FDAARGOS_372]BAD56377.1 hypothetical protein NFA_15320 [Nocardia farcinica IFM 10152]